jgi:hypothetical protein
MAQHDAVLGTLKLDGGALVVNSAAIPDDIVAVGLRGATLYGVSQQLSLHSLGVLPNLTMGTAIASIVAPADRDAGVFVSGFVASSGNFVVAGYTKLGTTFPGSLALVNVVDGGATYVDAPGNYTAVGIDQGFVLNSIGLGTQTGSAIYALNTSDGGIATHTVATFNSAWQPASGFTGITPTGIGLFGYFGKADFQNHVRGVAPDAWKPAFEGATALPLSDATSREVLAGDDISDVTTSGENMIVIRGGYESTPPYSAFTVRVEKIPLMLSVGLGTVQTGTPVTVIDAPDKCTRVSFAVGRGTTLLLGVADKNGRRVVQLQP